jgi:hypothetical protein
MRRRSPPEQGAREEADFWASLAHIGTVYTAMGKWRRPPAVPEGRGADLREGREEFLSRRPSPRRRRRLGGRVAQLAALEAARAAEIGPSSEGKKAAGSLRRLLSIRTPCLLQAGRLDEAAEVGARQGAGGHGPEEWKEGPGSSGKAQAPDLVGRS